MSLSGALELNGVFESKGLVGKMLRWDSGALRRSCPLVA